MLPVVMPDSRIILSALLIVAIHAAWLGWSQALEYRAELVRVQKHLRTWGLNWPVDITP